MASQFNSHKRLYPHPQTFTFGPSPCQEWEKSDSSAGAIWRDAHPPLSAPLQRVNVKPWVRQNLHTMLCDQ